MEEEVVQKKKLGGRGAGGDWRCARPTVLFGNTTSGGINQSDLHWLFKVDQGILLGFEVRWSRYRRAMAKHASTPVARGEVGKWIAVIAVILRLFFPRHFPDWLELPGALILLILVAPSLFADTFRGEFICIFICLIIGCYLLQEHIRA